MRTPTRPREKSPQGWNLASIQPRSASAVRAAGLKRFYTGERCKHGHDCERYVSNALCVDCQVRWNGQLKSSGYFSWYEEANRLKRREQKAAYMRRNPEKRRVATIYAVLADGRVSLVFYSGAGATSASPVSYDPNLGAGKWAYPAFQ
jgi:hypothetical protein